MSALFDAINGSPMKPVQNQNGNILDNLRQFAGTISGNPEQIVRNLVSSGRMSQQQFSQFSQQASQLCQMLNLR